jgi:hypothetical protein
VLWGVGWKLLVFVGRYICSRLWVWNILVFVDGKFALVCGCGKVWLCWTVNVLSDLGGKIGCPGR